MVVSRIPRLATMSPTIVRTNRPFPPPSSSLITSRIPLLSSRIQRATVPPKPVKSLAASSPSFFSRLPKATPRPKDVSSAVAKSAIVTTSIASSSASTRSGPVPGPNVLNRLTSSIRGSPSSTVTPPASKPAIVKRASAKISGIPIRSKPTAKSTPVVATKPACKTPAQASMPVRSAKKPAAPALRSCLKTSSAIDKPKLKVRFADQSRVKSYRKVSPVIRSSSFNRPLSSSVVEVVPTDFDTYRRTNEYMDMLEVAPRYKWSSSANPAVALDLSEESQELQDCYNELYWPSHYQGVYLAVGGRTEPVARYVQDFREGLGCLDLEFKTF